MVDPCDRQMRSSFLPFPQHFHQYHDFLHWLTIRRGKNYQLNYCFKHPIQPKRGLQIAAKHPFISQVSKQGYYHEVALKTVYHLTIDRHAVRKKNKEKKQQ